MTLVDTLIKGQGKKKKMKTALKAAKFKKKKKIFLKSSKIVEARRAVLRKRGGGQGTRNLKTSIHSVRKVLITLEWDFKYWQTFLFFFLAVGFVLFCFFKTFSLFLHERHRQRENQAPR